MKNGEYVYLFVALVIVALVCKIIWLCIPSKSSKGKVTSKEFANLSNSVGFDFKNPHPVETLAFQTVAVSKLNPQKDSVFNHNDLTMYDTIIVTLFFVRMLCITQIKNKAKAEEFSDLYISKVFEYFPDAQSISKKYDTEFFTERVKFYDYLIANSPQSDGDNYIKVLVKAFTMIITYDYAEQYIRIDENTPLMIMDIFEQFKITNEVNTFFNTLPGFFTKLLPDIFTVYNSEDINNSNNANSDKQNHLATHDLKKQSCPKTVDNTLSELYHQLLIVCNGEEKFKEKYGAELHTNFKNLIFKTKGQDKIILEDMDLEDLKTLNRILAIINELCQS